MNFDVNGNLNKINTQSELNTPPKSKPQNVIKKTTQYIPKSEPQPKKASNSLAVSEAVNVKKHNSKADSDLSIILVLFSLSGYITAQLLSKYVL